MSGTAEWKRAWYRANRDKIRAEESSRRSDPAYREAANRRRRERYAQNPGPHKQRSLATYRQNPQRAKEASRAWRLANAARVKARAKESYLANREQERLVGKAWREANPQVVFAARLKKTYGITVEDYARLFNAQNQRCAACNALLDLNSRHTHLDHCHATGRIRGLLCNNCNSALGHARDSIERLRGLITYLGAP